MLRIAGALTVLALTASAPAASELNPAKAVALGVVEGVTEYLPVSSTGHLLVTQELLDVGETDATEDAAETYAITIQAGAILAVLVLYRRRLGSMVAGLVGRDPDGRRVLTGLALAFVPAAAIGVALDDTIKDRLFGVGPVAAAWIVGGVAVLAIARFVHAGERPLEAITGRDALVIGSAQVLALWPGTSRSLVTIVAALAIGLALHAALEFSFLLGLVTLTAATAYEAARNGDVLFDTFGVADPAVGFVVAFVSAVVAVRWLVAFVGRRGLAPFGWYRIAIGVIALGLLATDVL